ncbi:MAG: transketolase [Solirubrobacterales bacterium]|nr:transketolase [Solirubrobacterales bacterium]
MPRVNEPGGPSDTEQLAADTVRTLSIDAIDRANSGHPGAVMALAPLTVRLWQDYLRYDPTDPGWPDRDRFVLSAGHASMLLYSMIHLTGVTKADGSPAISLEDIKNFRQLGSPTPGHPESHLTVGVETTTGPLGQGVATSVGMAMAGLWKKATFGQDLFDYDVYVICSDGDLMEGVSQEAISLAGHQQLSNLCWIYDSNRISIDGSTDLTFSDDVGERFRASGWAVSVVEDANDVEAFSSAVEGFKAEADRPSLIIVHSKIGFGSPNKVDTAGVHGSPLGEEETRLTKEAYGWPEDAHFLVPDEVPEFFRDGIGKRGAELRTAWQARLEQAPAEQREMLAMMLERSLPEGWDSELPSFEAGSETATRKAAQKALRSVAPNVPWLMSGSADLTGSASSGLDPEVSGTFEPGERTGQGLHLGVREHESAALSNGLALGDMRPVWSTYLIFSDYARPAIRLSALMELPVIHWLTHDSIGLGEDGPTHQPVEQLPSLRAVPGLDVVRPADGDETSEALKYALLRNDGPTALVLTRQDVPNLDRSVLASAEGLMRGGYVLSDPDGAPEVILIASGSEVHLAVEAAEVLAGEGIGARVVSLPCWEAFDRQDADYRDSVLPPGITARVGIEQASPLGWDRFVGTDGAMIAMHGFGASAPFRDLRTHFGFTVEAVVEAARKQVRGS